MAPVAAGPVDERPTVPERVVREIEQIRRDTGLRRRIRELYGSRCQACGIRIRIGPDDYFVIAAHIRPLGEPHNGQDDISNMLALCPNHHVEFDAGVFSVSPDDYRIYHFFEDTRLHERELTLVDAHGLNPDHLRYHWENIYMENAS